MELRRITTEHLLYTLAFALALAVRFLNLGAAPLSDLEAGWALQALQLAGRQPGGIDSPMGPQPAYVLLTGASFALFGATNFLARFWPALAGGLLALVPLLFRRQLGPWPGVILAFGLALDPGLVAASRQVGGPVLAISFGLLALGLWLRRRPIPAGLCAGVALLSGPALFSGALAFALAWLAWSAWTGSRPSYYTDQGVDSPAEAHTLQPLLYSAGAAVLLLGTLFLWAPQGLGALAGVLPAYFAGWTGPAGAAPAPAFSLLAALPAYQPLALIFALVAAGRLIAGRITLRQGTGDPDRSTVVTAFLALLVVFALIVILFYPARQVTDLAWVLVPLWALAAMELARYWPENGMNWIGAAQAALVVVLLVLFWLTLAGLARAAPNDQGIPLRLGIMGGILALIPLTSLLVGMGWSYEAGKLGFAWGLIVPTGIYCLSALWGAAQVRPHLPQELWYPPPAPGQTALFLDTLEDLSEWHTGVPDVIAVKTNVDSPSLRWALKDFENLDWVSGPLLGELPPVLITSQAESAPELAEDYRGQDFVWRVWPGWPGPLPDKLAAWFVFREAPLQNEHIILWARTDIFPGAASLE